jgi:DNA invertase Pin-like site-specific DNA recombinase
MGGKGKRVALYLKVSTDGQTTRNQQDAPEQHAKRAGWRVDEVYKDHGISVAKGCDKRPAFDRLCKDATRRQFDIIAAWSVDRLGRSLQDLLAFLGDAHAVGVDLYLHQQAVDTTTLGGKALFQMMGVFAEFERAMIRERVNAGLKRARAQGKKLGRPRVSTKVEDAVRVSLAAGTGILKTAKCSGWVLGQCNGSRGRWRQRKPSASIVDGLEGAKIAFRGSAI